ncbi:MAG: thioredoxin-disulfide reductase [Spirochaetaceae bacterium]|nr:thioredoxin-disulfide reductase [Spirochaetaceae bacterium]
MNQKHELVIIGAGPAGLAAAQYAARANLDVLVIEEFSAGGQSLAIDKLENYPGILEPVSGFQLADMMRTQAERFGASFISASVLAVKKCDRDFAIDTSEGSIEAGAVIVATGAKHRHIGVPGEEAFAGKGVSYCATCDGPFFRGKRIFVIGGGDSACDEAMYLAKLSDQVIMIHRKERFRAQKALASQVNANPHIHVLFNTTAVEIKGGKKVESILLRNVVTNETHEEPADAVFVFIGSDPQTGIVPFVSKDKTGSILVDDHMRTSVPGLFAAGDVRVSPFRQIVTACADGAIAAHAASQYLDEVQGNAYR